MKTLVQLRLPFKVIVVPAYQTFSWCSRKPVKSKVSRTLCNICCSVAYTQEC